MPVPSIRGRLHVPGRLFSSMTSIPLGGMVVKIAVTPARLLALTAIWWSDGKRVFRQDAYGSPMNAEELFLANVTTIDRIAAFICRRNHVADEAEEFASQVKLSLLERNYEIIRK